MSLELNYLKNTEAPESSQAFSPFDISDGLSMREIRGTHVVDGVELFEHLRIGIVCNTPHSMTWDNSKLNDVTSARVLENVGLKLKALDQAFEPYLVASSGSYGYIPYETSVARMYGEGDQLPYPSDEFLEERGPFAAWILTVWWDQDLWMSSGETEGLRNFMPICSLINETTIELPSPEVID